MGISRALTTHFRARLTRGVSAGALGSALLFALSSTSALAQDAAPVADIDEEDETIIVTGFRASLESAVAEKKSQDLIVESISAEDIGKLPDASIAESIARLPGLTSQRVSGRSNVISIRGFGPDFSQTLLNGREQTSTGDNRAVEFDQYPSEIVSQVVVYKTPSASLVGQGLVGTIDIRTVRPLEAGNQVIAIGARGSYADLGKLNAGSEELGYRVNGAYIDQFGPDDNVGIALSGSYVDEPYQIQEFNAWGYDGAGTDASPFVIGGSKSFVTSTQLKRLGLQGTLQYRVAPTTMVTVDAFYSNFKDDQIKRGIELPLGFGGTRTVTSVEDGVATAGTFTNVEGVVRNDAFERHADLYSFGFNANHEGDDGWNAFFDVGYSRTDRNELILESYAGTGQGAFNAETNADDERDTIGFQTGTTGTIFSPTLDYSDPNLIVLTDPLGWQGTPGRVGYSNNRIVEDELKQFRAEVERELNGGFLSAVKAGLNYTDRDKALRTDENFVTLAGGVSELPIPDEFLLEPTDLTYLGLGPMVSYDPRALLAAGVLGLQSNPTNAGFAGQPYSVSEDLMTLYAQADIEAELGSSLLTGNVGVQAINTDQESTGNLYSPEGLQQATFGADYWDVLPSLNLSLRLPSDFVIRVAAAREIQRPRLDQMRVSLSYGIDMTGGPGNWVIRGGGGNPLLRPFRANAVDLNFEKYFGTNGYVALQLFYKDLKNFIYDNVEAPFDYTGLPLNITPEQAAANLPSRIGTISQPVNTGGGKMYGAELAATLPFDIFTEALSGFGVTGGVAYTKTSVRQTDDGPKTTIPGYSKWVANGTAYFEKWGFSARGSVRYRSTFLGELTGFGAARTNRQALAETIVDAQLGYDFQPGALEGLSIFLQGQNLTDERFATVAAPGETLRVIDYQIYGRRFLAGFTFKF